MPLAYAFDARGHVREGLGASWHPKGSSARASAGPNAKTPRRVIPSGLLYRELSWLRGLDLNQRPSGYEPDELPGCSTPRRLCVCIVNGFLCARTAEPGGVLLFQRLSVSTMGAAWFHGRVRDGIGWVTGAMTTELRSPCEIV